MDISTMEDMEQFVNGMDNKEPPGPLISNPEIIKTSKIISDSEDDDVNDKLDEERPSPKEKSMSSDLDDKVDDEKPSPKEKSTWSDSDDEDSMVNSPSKSRKNRKIVSDSENSDSEEDDVIKTEIPLPSELIKQEAQLEAFLEARQAKKKFSIAERLKNLPGFDKIANMKPQVGGSKNKSKPTDLIVFDDDDEDDDKPVKITKNEKGITELVRRLAKQVVGPVRDEEFKPQHTKVLVHKVEKDSEGMLQGVVDEIDYVSSAPGEEDGLMAKINCPGGGSSTKEQVPGEKHARLKTILLQQIRKKTLKEIEERTKEHDIHKKELELEDQMSDEELPDDELLDDEEMTSEDEEDALEELLMGEKIKKEKKRKKSKYVDDEAEDEDGDDESSENEEESDDDGGNVDEEEEDAKSLDEVENTTEDDSERILDTPKARRRIIETDSASESSIPDPIAKLVALQPFESSENLVDLCSGIFPSQAPQTPFETQVNSEQDENVENVEEKVEGEEESPPEIEIKIPAAGQSMAENTPKVLIDSDDEDIGPRSSKKIKRKRLQFSDDEEEEKPVEDEADGIEMDSEPEEVEDEEALEDEEMHEDDEEDLMEREIQAELAAAKAKKGLFGKDGRLKKKFVEAEAELSGSEEGSGDEDEKGLNFYEEEEGDDDEMDEEALKSEVEKVHLKQVLDQDVDEIEDLKERYIREEFNAREKKFRWNNINEWDDQAMTGDSDGEQGEDEEEEQLKLKLAEIERKKWLEENSQLLESQEDLFENSKFLRLGKSNTKKITNFVENNATFVLREETCDSAPNFSITSLVKSKLKVNSKSFFSSVDKQDDEAQKEEDEFKKICSKSNSQPLFASPDESSSRLKRGSFLSRGSPSLTRLAEFSKINDSANNVKNNSRNFVFSVITPPDQASKQKLPKRQSQGGMPPKKIAKIDRSFSNLDETSKGSSIFKYM